MPVSTQEDYLTNENQKQFSNQTFSDFRAELLQYANSFYKNQIVDFSETSLGGMLLDFAAIVGDSLIYYAEQQFNELNYETAVDFENISKHLKRANIKNSYASPASVKCTFSIEIERDPSSKDYDPKPYSNLLPVIKKGTVLSSINGINFILQEDIDFSDDYKLEIGEENINGSAFSLFLSKDGLCSSGNIAEEIFTFPNTGNVFISRELSNQNITSIISVVDEDNNEYYEVDYLTQTTVYKKVQDSNDNYMIAIPAPRRYIIEDSFLNNSTTLRFGNGDGKSIRNNLFANPEELLLPIKDKNTISRVDLDPSMLLENSTFGISPKGKSLTVRYKYGGGPDHNLPAGSINIVKGEPIITFPNNPDILSQDVVSQILNSLSVTNKNSAVGGSSALTIDELKEKIPSAIRAQSRIITYEDLISRMMTMPTEFGKVNKMVALDNKFNSSSKDLFVICKDSEGFYTEANDAIKTNLSNYINDFRLIGYNFNILDVPVFNFGIKAKVNIKQGYDIFNSIAQIRSALVSEINFDLLQIGSPININTIAKIIEGVDAVESLQTERNAIVISKTSEDEFFDQDELTTRSYNDNVFNPQALFKNGLIYPPRGGLFEMKYTSRDIEIGAN